MNITDPFVIPEDVVVTPVAELPPTLQAQIGGDPEDFAISRARSRTNSKVVDSAAGALLQRFRTPTTIISAILAQSRDTREDPNTLLDAAFPLLQSFIQANLLVPLGSLKAKPIRPGHPAGARIGRYEILRPLQVLDDTELYQVRGAEGEIGVLKLARPESASHTHAQLQHEAVILRGLRGDVTPRLLAQSTYETSPYLVIAWREGVDAQHAAHTLRREHPEEQAQRVALGRLALNILESYAALHAQGVVHGDIHPRNLLVDRDLRVTLIDFGVADRPESTLLRRPPRAGVGFYFEPEYAAAFLERRPLPAASFAGEQYALAVLLYELFTQATYLEFELGREEMFEQIAHALPLPFSAHGLAPWPEVEDVLARALSKLPEERFADVAAFAQALRGAIASAPVLALPMARPHPADHPLVADTLTLIAPEGGWFREGLPQAPTASIKFGAAGIAFALYRIARARDDGALLARADLWLDMAEREAQEARGYENESLQVTAETVGRISPLHAPSGIPFVRAVLAAARGDGYGQQQATTHFVEAATRPPEGELDLTLGRGSLLLAASSLLNLATHNRVADSNQPLLDLGNSAAGAIQSLIDGPLPIRDDPDHVNLGIAHGWAGYLYALLRWYEITQQPTPTCVVRRLDELAALAEPQGRGINWKWELTTGDAPPNYIAGWCNGSAGHVFLWTLAHRLLDRAHYAELAERAAWHTWEAMPDVGSLCCGAAGRAYALLNWHNHSQETVWLRRARVLAEEAAQQIKQGDNPAQSLYKGQVGVAVLLSELTDPRYASMPTFELEG